MQCSQSCARSSGHDAQPFYREDLPRQAGLSLSCQTLAVYAMPFQSALNSMLDAWRTAHPNKRFPAFDPKVQRSPHTLVLLESPGPMVESTKVVSVSNPDGTAKEMQRLLSIAFDQDAQSDVLCWNAVPWFLDRSPRASDIAEAKQLHGELLTLIRPSLKCVLLLGTWARGLLPYCSPRVGNAFIYGGHHPGRQAQIQKGLIEENEAVFAWLRKQFQIGSIQRK